jgi:hypothetical protein
LLVRSGDIQEKEIFDACLQTASNLQTREGSEQAAETVYATVEYLSASIS